MSDEKALRKALERLAYLTTEGRTSQERREARVMLTALSKSILTLLSMAVSAGEQTEEVLLSHGVLLRQDMGLQPIKDSMQALLEFTRAEYRKNFATPLKKAGPSLMH